MAIVTVPPFYFPPYPTKVDGPGTFLNFLLNAVGEKYGAIVEAPKTGTISKILWRTGTVTTGANVDVRVETIDASGDPSGTLLAANTNGIQVVGNGDDNTAFQTALTSGPSVTLGDQFAVALVPDGGDMQIVQFTDSEANFPYGDHFTTAWAKLPSGPMIGLEYSDGSYAYAPGLYPASNFSRDVYNVDTGTADEYGNILQYPQGFRTCGSWFWGDLNQVADATIKLYDSDGSAVLASKSIIGVCDGSTGTHVHFHRFASTVNLLKDTSYRITLLPTTANSLDLETLVVPSAAVMDAWPGGQNTHKTQRLNNGGSWTQTTTQRAWIGLIIDGLDDGAGGGGLLTHPSMSGGMRG